MSVNELLKEARQKGINSIALTDINNTSACLEFIKDAPSYNIKPVVGIDFRSGIKQHYVVIAINNEGFYEANQHLSSVLSNHSALEKRAPAFQNCYVIYPFENSTIKELRNNEFIGVKPNDLNKLVFSNTKFHLNKMVALYPVTFRDKKDFNTHRLLRAIDNNTLLSKLAKNEQTDEHEIMLSKEALENKYIQFPQLISNTNRLLSECSIHFEYGKSKNKKTFTGDAQADKELLRNECLKGLKYRYPQADDTIKNRLDHELRLINEMGFCSYFLINWDIVNYAQHKNYFYVGRGSGANSLAAYCLKITDVDPVDLDLYFERFINPYRVNPPDFDIDFSWKDRDDITLYIFKKHGIKHTSLLATYNTFQSKAVMRELGKVFGLPKAEIDDLIDNRKNKQTPDNIAQLIHKYSSYIHDFPSHLSVHAGGVLISEKPINYYTATSMPPKGFPLTQFSMLEAEDIGLYKFDILSQRGLGHIKDSVALIKQNKGVEIDIHNIAAFKEDEKIKCLLRSGKTMGCFYVESPAMRMLFKKLETDTYLGVVAASSIIRPGVAKSGMMREYILRFKNPERRQYIHPKIGELMSETYGIMVYQEDVIKVAHYFAGLSLAQADVMRRGMSGKFRSREEFQKAKQDFFESCNEKKYPQEVITEVWRQIESFAGYSFSKGHSASYAVESYQSLYLKAHYPQEFMVGVINNFGGFYRTEHYIHEAKMSGANILAPCINNSEQLAIIKGNDIYLGFILLAELEAKTTELVLIERNKNGSFKNLEEFMKRVTISVEQLRILIRIGAFRFTGRSKKQLLWDIHTIIGANKKTKIDKELFEIQKKEFTLPELQLNQHDDAFDEIEILGYPLCTPFNLISNTTKYTIVAKDLNQHLKKNIEILGYYVTHKIAITSRGEEMSFGTFLDKDGFFLDTTHFPNTLKQFPFRGKGCYLIKGKVVEEFGFYSIDVIYLEKLGYITTN